MRSRLKQCIGFDDTWLRILGIPISAALIPFVFFGLRLSMGWNQIYPALISSFIFTLFFWESIRGLVIFIRRQYPSFSDSRKRILLQLLAATAVVVLIWPFCWAITGFSGMPPPDSSQIIAADATTILFFMSVYEGFFFYEQLKREIHEKESLRRAYVLSELEGLRNQVNPHFLFNSLNTLTNIVSEDPKLATAYVQRMSKVFRYVLEQRDKQLVSVQEELDFIESYIFLQQERFGRGLDIQIDIPNDLRSKMILPLSLQLLFENAIKHNVISPKRPLTIQLYATQDGKLVIENNLQRKEQVMDSTKVGLENVKQRYRFFTATPVDVLDGPDIFRVTIPALIP